MSRLPTRNRRATEVAAMAAAVALSLGLGLGACSTSGEDAGSDEPQATTTAADTAVEETTTTEADETTTTEAEDPDIDPDELDDAEDRVERVNLTIDDLPEGWTAEPNEDTDDSVMDTCSTVGLDEHTVAEASSDRFSLQQDQGVLTLETGTGYLDDESVAVDLMAELAGDEFAACASEGLLDAGEVEIQGELMPTSGLPELGDEATALQGDFSLTDSASGESAQLSVLVIAIRTDQVVTVLTATAIDTPGDEQLLYGLLDVIAERQEL
jgi:hypothetical protein